MAKKGGLSSKHTLYAVLFVILGAVAVYYISIGGFAGSIADTSKPISGGVATTTSEFCSNNPSVDLKVEAFDSLTSTTTRRNVSFYVKDTSNNQISEYWTDTTVGGKTQTNAILCGHPVEGYIKTMQNGTNAQITTFRLSAQETMQDPVIVDMKVVQHDNLEARCYDRGNGRYVDTRFTDNSQTDYDYVDGNLTCYGSASNTTTAKAIGTDELLEWNLEVKTQSANTEFGQDTLIAVDLSDSSNADDWDQSSLVLTVNDQELEDVTSSISSNDLLALTGYEKVYKMPKAIGETASVIKMTLRAGAGINPDFDPVLRFVATGNYQDDKDSDNIVLNAGFRTDTSRTQMATSPVQKIIISVS